MNALLKIAGEGKTDYGFHLREARAAYAKGDKKTGDHHYAIAQSMKKKLGLPVKPKDQGLAKVAGELYNKKTRQEDRLHDVYHGEKVYRSQKAFDQAYDARHSNVVATHHAILAKTGLPSDFNEDEAYHRLHHAEQMLVNNKKHSIKAPALVAGLTGAYGLVAASQLAKPTLRTYAKGGAIGAAIGGLGMKALMMHSVKHARKEVDTLSPQLEKYRSA